MNKRTAFTLIELLVVIAIIAILAAILFPVFAQAKAAAKKTASLSNIKQVNTGLILYGSDYDDTYICEWPYNNFHGQPGTAPTYFDGDHTFHGFLYPYTKSKDIWKSPGAGSEVYTSKKIFGTNTNADGLDSNFSGGYSTSYLMNETGWSDNNYNNLDKILATGLNQSVLSHPAEQVIFIEAAGTAFWMNNGYGVGFTTDCGSSATSATGTSDPNMDLAIDKDFYNVPGRDCSAFGVSSYVPARFGVSGTIVGYFDSHAKFVRNLKLRNVQPYNYDWDNIAKNW